MKLNLVTPAIAITIWASLVIAGCAESGPNPEPDESVQAELERLENELGRLEFRVYQLEHPDDQANADTSAPSE